MRSAGIRRTAAEYLLSDTTSMTNNRNSSSTAEAELPTSRNTSAAKVLLAILKYVGSYVLGIAACVLFTPVELELAGVVLWPYYPVFAAIGFFLFYLYLSSAYLPFGGSGASYWLLFSIGFVPVVFEAAAHFVRMPSFRACRPLWIGFPIGFAGTLGVYYTAAASI